MEVKYKKLLKDTVADLGTVLRGLKSNSSANRAEIAQIMGVIGRLQDTLRKQRIVENRARLQKKT